MSEKPSRGEEWHEKNVEGVPAKDPHFFLTEDEFWESIDKTADRRLPAKQDPEQLKKVLAAEHIEILEQRPDIMASWERAGKGFSDVSILLEKKKDRRLAKLYKQQVIDLWNE